MQFSDWASFPILSYLLFFLSGNTSSRILRLSPVGLLWITLECRIYLCQKEKLFYLRTRAVPTTMVPYLLMLSKSRVKLNTVKIHFLSDVIAMFVCSLATCHWWSLYWTVLIETMFITAECYFAQHWSRDK